MRPFFFEIPVSESRSIMPFLKEIRTITRRQQSVSGIIWKILMISRHNCFVSIELLLISQNLSLNLLATRKYQKQCEHKVTRAKKKNSAKDATKECQILFYWQQSNVEVNEKYRHRYTDVLYKHTNKSSIYNIQLNRVLEICGYVPEKMIHNWYWYVLCKLWSKLMPNGPIVTYIVQTKIVELELQSRCGALLGTCNVKW